MARALTSAMLAAIAGGTLRPVFFYEGEFSGGTVRLFTGHGTLVWDGETWTGDSGLLRINSIAEAGDLAAVNFSVGLAGEVTSLLAAALAQVRRGLPGKVWLGLFDDSGALIADPFLCFAGRADRPDIVPDPQNCSVSVAYESRLIDAGRRRERRYTSEDQQIDYPGDLGFDYVPSLQDTVLTWGRR
jgi:hypothetical protein